MTTPVPAMLALKLNVPIVFASNQRLGGARFRVTMHPPLEFAPSGDIRADIRRADGGDQSSPGRDGARRSVAMAVDSPPLADESK